MDTDSIVNSSFDMASAQVDVMHVPDGVDRMEIARAHYEQFLNAPRGKRDWAKELAEDARANEKTYGPSRAGARSAASIPIVSARDRSRRRPS
jgi:hypothetical protein